MGHGKKTAKGRLDKYYHLAKDQGYRARSAFKLIQLAKKFDFLSKSKVCIDLCAAPGGWSQVAQRNMPAGSQIIAIDLAPIRPIHGVTCIQSDITTDKCRSLLRKELQNTRADCVIHDGAPDMGSSWAKDAFSQSELTLHSLKLACEHLRPGGTFVSKVFRSADYNSLLWVFNQLFNKVDATKPTASRNVSAEIFVICIGFKAGKIDPRFFDPKWVFMEALGNAAEDDGEIKKPSASLADHFKSLKRRHRGGYELGDDLKIIAAHEYIASPKPADILIAFHRLNLEAPGSEAFNEHPLTTPEIRELCGDLKVCGKGDLGALLKWRMRILREREKVERAAKKAAEQVASALAIRDAVAKKKALAGAAPAGASLQQDVDDAIAEILGGAPPVPKGTAAEADDAPSTDDEAAEEELERNLSKQVDKRRREERRDKKKTGERQKKQEWRRKMSLGGGTMLQDQPELFRATKRSVEAMAALQDGSAYVNPETLGSDADGSGSDQEQDGDSDSDEGLDRLARMEVDLAVDHQLRRLRLEDKCRSVVQRMEKRKKETRRQRVVAAWAGEFSAFSDSIDRQAAEQHALRNRGDDDDEDDDSDMDLQELREYQKSLTSSGATGADAEALRALADGPDGDGGYGAAEASTKGDSSQKNKDGEGDEEQVSSRRVKSRALVPADDEPTGEVAVRDDHRASRWFSQDIFKGVGTATSSRSGSRAIIPLDRDSEDDDSEGGMVRELPDSKLPKMPLTDKEKRKIKRKKDLERHEKMGKKPKKEEEDNGPLEVAPLEPPRPIVGGSIASRHQKPSDPRELAETLALGSLLVESKKSRMELIDAAYNRWTFEQNLALPDWFTEEESKYNKPEMPISRELMAQFRAKLREINARPIRKVAEAKARKKRRLQKRLEKLRTTAMSLADTPDMSESAKARQMRKAVSKMARQEQRKVTVVAMKKGGGGTKTSKGKASKDAKTKVVDRRLKKDRRAEKRQAKKNPKKVKMALRKQMIKKERGRRSGSAKKLTRERRSKRGEE